MSTSLDRRDLLQVMGYGAATVSLPFVAGCGRTEIQRLTSKSPSLQEPGKDSGAVSVSHFDAFGVDEGLIRKVLSRALSRGASFSEIFLQHRVSHWVGMEDGEVNRAYSEVGLGAGIRVIQGDTTGFSFTEDLTPGALLEAADMASAVADGPSSPRSITLTPRIVVSRYTVETPWTEVGIDRKLPIVQRAEKAARNHDTRIIKVTVALQDETSHILIANSEGLLVADERPMGVLSVSCVGENKGKTETGTGPSPSAMGFVFSRQLISTTREPRQRAIRCCFLKPCLRRWETCRSSLGQEIQDCSCTRPLGTGWKRISIARGFRFMRTGLEKESLRRV